MLTLCSSAFLRLFYAMVLYTIVLFKMVAPIDDTKTVYKALYFSILLRFCSFYPTVCYAIVLFKVAAPINDNKTVYKTRCIFTCRRLENCFID